jgi:hypothetical protein
MKSLFVFMLAIMFSLVSYAQKPNLNGRWESIKPEAQGQVFATRDFTFKNDKWSIIYTVYGDSEKKYPVFSFEAEGSFKVGKKSDKVDNTYEADFSFSKKYVTLLTDDEATIKSIGFDACNLKKGVKTDISQNGCSFLASVKNYGLEYDLISLNGTELKLGSRPADGNMSKPELRPTQLGEPLKKKK